ncbi:urea transport system substrate-binding protein [Mariprofundus micogutta]|uniref:Urea transport system substrate-binding protein n=1 Tax=Mariprofundus micogutta TaxID=1921010 RepID=A0A1L8CP36_9PROT|nr:urea ABC transporter substrate-binding protein [Mariprofundus micogutta]GAV20685.1 urea transport system substrate-binding protein [Mariprofundus micogutta]
MLNNAMPLLQRAGLKQTYKYLLLPVMGCALLLLLTACQNADKEPIKIGILHSLTGTMAISEKPVVDATLLAIEEINAKGGLLGRQLKPIIADGKSDPATFASEARRLIKDEQVAVTFGCWTSASRKTVKPVIEQYDSLLFYPLQYEGFEQSPHIIYTGNTPNQQIIPAISWSNKHLGKRLFLIGSDYIFPRVANWIIKKQASILDMEIVGEIYQPLGSSDFDSVAREIISAKPDVVINTINGDSNISFFKALFEADITSSDMPVLSFSISENELAVIPEDHSRGHYAAWSYFQSIDSHGNREFVRAFKTHFGKQRLISDPMEAAYIGVHLWAKAAQLINSIDAKSIIFRLKTITMEAPQGIVAIDLNNHHLWKQARIGKIVAQHQFETVWQSESSIQPMTHPLGILQDDAEHYINSLFDLWGQQWSARPQEE